MPDLRVSATVDDLLLAALQRGGDMEKTGRFLMTFKEGAADAAMDSMRTQSGIRMANARDFADQAVTLEATGDADAVVFPEIGVAVVGGEVAAERSLSAEASLAEDSPYQSIDPEYFMFTAELEAAVLGATWGLSACRVPPSAFSGLGIKVAVLDTGFDLGHPEFAGRAIVGQTFVGQPVQDLHGHGTHTAGTACGPLAPGGSVPRYGIGHPSQIFIGKVLSNSGSGTQAQVLAGMNWAIVNKCAVISMSLGAQIGVQPSYTAAGQAALNNGCLIVAAAGNASNRPTLIRPAGAPANSPTIVSVASLDQNLKPSVFSNGGKIDIAGPGGAVFSSWPRPTLHRTISGTGMATPHVAGCAALWAQTSALLRGAALRPKLFATAKKLPLPKSDVGAGLVQAP